MRSTASKFLGLCLLWACFGSIFANCSKAQVEAADLRWAQAIDSNQINTVVNLYAPQAVLLATVKDAPIVTRQERTHYFKHFFKTYKKAKVAYVGQKYIQVFNGGAVSSGLYVFSGIKNGKMTEIPARYSFVYRATNRGCQLITHHSSQLPE